MHCFTIPYICNIYRYLTHVLCMYIQATVYNNYYVVLNTHTFFLHKYYIHALYHVLITESLSSGTLLHFEDHGLKETYFLDPQWLAKLMASIIHPAAEQGKSQIKKGQFFYIAVIYCTCTCVYVYTLLYTNSQILTMHRDFVVQTSDSDLLLRARIRGLRNKICGWCESVHTHTHTHTHTYYTYTHVCVYT